MQRNRCCVFLIATGILCVSGHRYDIGNSNVAVNGQGAMSDSAERVDSGALLNQLTAYNEALKEQVENLKVQLQESQQQEADLMSQMEEDEEQAEAADLDLDEDEEEQVEEANEDEEDEAEEDEDQAGLDDDLAATEMEDHEEEDGEHKFQASLMQEDEEVDEEAQGSTPCQKFCMKQTTCGSKDATAQFPNGEAPEMQVKMDAPKYMFWMRNDKKRTPFFHPPAKRSSGFGHAVAFEEAASDDFKVSKGDTVKPAARPVTAIVNGKEMRFLPLEKKMKMRHSHGGHEYTYVAIDIEKLKKKHRVACKTLRFIGQNLKHRGKQPNYPTKAVECQPWNLGRAKNRGRCD